MKEKLEQIIVDTLPGFWWRITEREKHYNDNMYLQIEIAAKDYLINGVAGQRPQDISLMCEPEIFELRIQMYGGNGGQSIYRVPDKNHPRERYLALARTVVPFRRPQPNEKALLNAFRKFLENYKRLLKENRATLCYQDIVDYDTLLNG